jgi:hypothetical protein
MDMKMAEFVIREMIVTQKMIGQWTCTAVVASAGDHSSWMHGLPKTKSHGNGV